MEGVIKHTQYECETCGTRYENEDAAVMCANQLRPDDGGIKAGDIVVCHSGYGWYDGSKKWISNPDVILKGSGKACPNGDSNCFGVCCTYQFYYVVGTVELENKHDRHSFASIGKSKSGERVNAHRIKYHLFSRALLHDGLDKQERGKPEAKEGYTFDQDHYTPELVDPQPKLPGATKLIGQRSEHLL